MLFDGHLKLTKKQSSKKKIKGWLNFLSSAFRSLMHVMVSTRSNIVYVKKSFTYLGLIQARGVGKHSSGSCLL